MYGIINNRLQGNFYYLEPQLKLAGELDSAAFSTTIETFLKEPWLLFPFVGLLTAAGMLGIFARGFLRQRKLTDMSDVLVFGALGGLQFLLVLAVFLRYQLTGKHPILDDYPYGTYLTPFAVIAISSAIAMVLSQARDGQRLLIAGAAVVCMLAPLVIWALDMLPEGCTRCDLTPVAYPLAIAGFALLLSAVVLKRGLLVLPALIVLSALNGMGAAASGAVYFADQDLMHDRFLMTYDAEEAIKPFNEGHQLRIWYDREDPLFGVFESVAYLHIGRHFLGDGLPFWMRNSIRPEDWRYQVAVLSSAGDPTAAVNETLAASDLGLRVELVDTKRIDRGAEGFNVYILDFERGE